MRLRRHRPDWQAISAVLDEVVALLGAPTTDVTWSYFESPEAAGDEVRELLARVRRRDKSVIDDLRVLFVAAGALQDTSINSGWADRFVELTSAFDRAIGEPQATARPPARPTADIDDSTRDRDCSGCDRRYSFLTRGVSGPFHLLVMRVEHNDDGTSIVIGHWRSGTWDPGAVLEQTLSDGTRVTVPNATMEPPVSSAAATRGQAALRVSRRDAEALEADRCLWAADSRTATHPDPVWRDRSNYIIRVDLAEHGMPDAFEQLWTRQIDDGLFEMCCVPFFTYGIALGDVGEWTESSHRFDVKQKSGRRVIRVAFSDRSDAALGHEALHGALVTAGFLVEFSDSGYVSIDIASEEDLRATLAVIEPYVTRDRAIWEWAAE